MNAVDTIDIAPRYETVMAQLKPIKTRTALLESYRRESLNRLAASYPTDGSAADVLDLAYAMRWLELEPEATDPLTPLADESGE